MKILHICQSYPPMISGAALVSAQLAEGLVERGHNVLVIAASERREAYTARSKRVRVARLHSRHNPTRRGQRFLLWPRCQLRDQIQAFQPDIIHLHDPLTLGLCTLEAAHNAAVPVVLTLHALPWLITSHIPGSPAFVEWFVWRYGKWFLGRCDASVVAMDQIADIVKQHTGIRPRTIPLGINLAKFNPRTAAAGEAQRLCSKYGLPPGRPLMLHTGRLDRDKGVHIVVQAAARVMQVMDAELLVVGDGTQKQRLIELCAALEIGEHCHFTGFVDPQGDLPGLYRLADVFLCASEIETFGIVVLEAMAAGCPVVAVNATSMPDLVADQHSGYLVPPGDAERMADQTLALLRSPERAAALGRAGLKISRSYSDQTMVQNYESLYGTVQAQYEFAQ